MEDLKKFRTIIKENLNKFSNELEEKLEQLQNEITEGTREIGFNVREASFDEFHIYFYSITKDNSWEDKEGIEVYEFLPKGLDELTEEEAKAQESESFNWFESIWRQTKMVNTSIKSTISFYDFEEYYDLNERKWCTYE